MKTMKKNSSLAAVSDIVNPELKDLLDRTNAGLTPAKPRSYTKVRTYATLHTAAEILGSTLEYVATPMRSLQRKYREHHFWIIKQNALAEIQPCPDCSPVIREDFATSCRSDACVAHQDLYRLTY